MPFGAGDKHHEPFGDIDPVNEQDIMDLTGKVRQRPKGPKSLRPTLEGRLRTPLFLERALTHEPPEECLKLLGGIVYPMGFGCPAGLAAPPLSTRFGLAVSLHRCPACAALWIVHTKLPSRFNFSLGKECLNRDVKSKPDTLFETPKSWAVPTF